MRPYRVLCIACSLLFLAATPLLAQYTIKKIVFDGITPYTQAALEAASGLKAGDSMTSDSMQQAAQRLVDTGAFDDLQVTVDGPTKAISVIFKVKPANAAHQLTATFDNFIWFTPAELDAGLHARVPLYGALLPESGNLQDTVQTALSDMLKEKGVTATLDHQVFEPSVERPARIVAYRVKTPSILIHTVHLTGVTQEFAPAIQERAGKIVGRPFGEGLEHLTTAEILLTPYLTAGYLNAQLSNRMLTPTASSPERIDVDLAATVETGVPFHVGEIVWAGSPEMSSAAFAAASPLHSGDLASTVTLAKSVDLLAAAYRKEGRNDVIVSPGSSIDKATSLVSYTFGVTPGEVYHVRSITPINLSPAQQNDFSRGWLLKPGDVYNPEYIQNFLKMNTALRSFEGYSASFKAVSDPENHLVDVALTFSRGSSPTAH
jgi:outer membrane protein assembly factor BamA